MFVCDVNVRSRQRSRYERVKTSRRAIALAVTGVLVVLVAVMAVVFALRDRADPLAASSATSVARGSPGPASPTIAAGDPAGLDAAADAVGFHVTTGPDVGLVEALPAGALIPAPSRSLLPVGAMAPDFTLAATDGRRVSLSDYRGKTVLLEFGATWCAHCQAEAPHLLRLYDALPAEKVAFLSVNGNSEDAASVHAFSRYFGLPWPALLDPGSPPGSFRRQGGIGPVSRAYGLALFPTFYLIDPEGRIAWRGDREQPDALLLEMIRDVAGL
jgi:peroxiredoxin